MHATVDAHQYQKQQGQTSAILRRSCSLGTNDPQRPTFHIARRSSFHVDRLSHPTVDRHPTFIVNRSTSFDRAPSPSIDRRYECGRRAYDIYGAKKFRWEQKDEYGVYRDESGYARSVADEMIPLLKLIYSHTGSPSKCLKIEEILIYHGFDPFSSMVYRSLKEISSELTIRDRYEEEAIVRYTSSAVHRYRREASTIDDYDRSMYIMYHRSMSRHEMRDLVPADFKPKASPNYKITPDEFLT
ncbi:hypothetical protein F2Q70_00020136 [Brassica cretica]|uniref:Uncharacterized protein n=1 Tax=Brassica cretica TaxID=69181 RepID=A0A8S9GXG0_BRACR|nr:hypothetical protein F2Q70_00020136 [Brassica cretica]